MNSSMRQGNLNLNNCIYIYECILRQIKKNVEPVQHNYVTRYASNHSIPIPRLYGTHLQHSFLYNGAKFYDSLPIQFKVNCNPRQKGYKNRLKVYKMENPERELTEQHSVQ